MPARITITPLVCRQLDFLEQVVSTKNGRPVTRPTPPEIKAWWIADAKVTGLWIRMTPGSMTWYVRRKLGGQTTGRAIAPVLREGAPGDALDVTTARVRAQVWLGHMARGEDPLQIKKAIQATTAVARERDRLTMAVAYDEYCAAGKAGTSTGEDRRKVIKWMAKAPIWHLPVADITIENVATAMGPLLLRARGEAAPRHHWGPDSISAGTLSKIYAYLAAAWTRAARRLQIPAGRGEGPWALWRADQRWPLQVERQTMLDTETDQGVAWLRELVGFQQRSQAPDVLANRADPRGAGLKPHVSVLADYYVLLLLWGTRRTETALLRWDAVRFDKEVVMLAPETTKTGKLDTVPLTKWAKEILLRRREFNAAWRPDAPSPFVFPSRQHGKPINNPRSVLDALNEATGLSISAHDLRRTMATELGSQADQEQAARLLLAGAALHHSGRGGLTSGGATERYLLRKAEVLRPLFQEREERLRRLAGLAVERRELAGVTSTDALLAQAMEDPEFQRRYFEALSKR